MVFWKLSSICLFTQNAHVTCRIQTISTETYAFGHDISLQQIRNIWLIFLSSILKQRREKDTKRSPWSSKWIQFLTALEKDANIFIGDWVYFHWTQLEKSSHTHEKTNVMWLFWTCLHKIGGARTTYRQIRSDCSLT